MSKTTVATLKAELQALKQDYDNLADVASANFATLREAFGISDVHLIAQRKALQSLAKDVHLLGKITDFQFTTVFAPDSDELDFQHYYNEAIDFIKASIEANKVQEVADTNTEDTEEST